MSEHYVSVRDDSRHRSDRDDALKSEISRVDRYIELDEIELVHRYDEFHALEQRSLIDVQRQTVDFIIQELLRRIEYKISPSFRQQLEQEAAQTNQLQKESSMPPWAI